MVRIERLTAADQDEWAELWAGYLSFYESRLSDDVTAHTFARLVDPDGDIHGAIARDEDGRAIGIVHWLMHPATWSRSGYCYLEDLFVSEAARGHGAGRALIEHVRQWAEDAGAAKVYWLTAETNTTARSLYDRVASRSGFVHYQIATGG
ncbi:N-acetyltransferase family protein [Microbacterium sp. NPDC055903]